MTEEVNKFTLRAQRAMKATNQEAPSKRGYLGTIHPWVPFAGIWKDHPEIDAWADTIAEHRAQLDKAASEE